MRLLFAHPVHPGQFGLLSRTLAEHHGHDIRFLSGGQDQPALPEPVLGYNAAEPDDLAPLPLWLWTEHKAVGRAEAAAERLARAVDAGWTPELVVAHCGTGLVRQLSRVVSCPIVGYVEFTYRESWLAQSRRPLPPDERRERDRAARAFNAAVAADLAHCHRAVCPLAWQWGTLPPGLRRVVDIFPDPVDDALYFPDPGAPRHFAGHTFAADERVVSYVAPRLEPVRCFDVFLQVVERVQQTHPETNVVVVGRAEGAQYSRDTWSREGFASFRDQCLARFTGTPDRILWVDPVPEPELADLFRLTDLHLYLSEPFPFSWSVLGALASGALVLSNRCGPAPALIDHGDNGLLGPLDPDRLARQVCGVLTRPAAFDAVRAAAAGIVRTHAARRVAHLADDLYRDVLAGQAP